MPKIAHQNHAINVENDNDQYLVCSIMRGTLLTRGEGEIFRRVRLNSVDQNILGGKDYEIIFNNP